MSTVTRDTFRHVTRDTLRHGDDMVDSQWVTVTEAAKRLGITRTAVYNRIKRRTLQTQTDNHGHQLVNVSDTVTRGTLRHVTLDTVTPTLNWEPPPEPRQPSADVPEMVPLPVHRETVEALQRASSEALAAVQAQHREHVEQMIRGHRADREREGQRHEAEICRLRREVSSAQEALRGERAWFMLYMTIALLLVALMAPWMRH